ncbi:uncharacterized protein LOC133174204 [Saccostrea echinata]|uniref:uncharacterized protein LOC133174204 n=1 Tax=Saccostrea echinata TaxID=191078 RepID=UPI002A80EF55|nr:uncharacterized protein LOC133174204 [Saccostrea echinata]
MNSRKILFYIILISLIAVSIASSARKHGKTNKENKRKLRYMLNHYLDMMDDEDKKERGSDSSSEEDCGSSSEEDCGSSSEEDCRSFSKKECEDLRIQVPVPPAISADRFVGDILCSFCFQIRDRRARRNCIASNCD